MQGKKDQIFGRRSHNEPMYVRDAKEIKGNKIK